MAVYNRISLILFVILGELVFFSHAISAEKTWFETFSDDVRRTWRQPEHYDLYLPVIVWHARFAYDKEKTDRYNERPWGGGFGQSRQDDKGNWHSLYMMAFKDSFNDWEPIAGYGYEKIWHPWQMQRFHLGLGYTAGVTMRKNWHYAPIPVLLPLASIGYGPMKLQMTYIPGTYNNGNVYFAWLYFQF